MGPGEILAALDALLESGAAADLVVLARGLPGRSLEARRKAFALDRGAKVRPAPTNGHDRHLTASQAAQIAGERYTAKWFYSNAHRLHFTRRDGRRVSFHEQGLREWLRGDHMG